MRTVVGRALRGLTLTVLLGTPATLALAQRQPAPSGLKVGLQVATGTVVAPVAFVAGGLATKWVAQRIGASEQQESSAAYVGAWSLAGIATAAVPPLMVRGGTYPAALVGTALGGAAAGLVILAGRRMFRDDAQCGVLCTSWGIVSFALPATGATLLYNRSR